MKFKFNRNTFLISTFLLFLFVEFFITPIVNFKGIGADLIKSARNLKGVPAAEYPGEIINAIDNAWSSNIVFQKKYIDVFGLIQRGMGKTIVYDADKGKTVVKGDDGKLYFVSDVTDVNGTENIDYNIIQENASNLMSLSEDFKDKDFLYVQAPFKYDSRYVKLPNGIEPLSNEPVDYFLSNLSECKSLDILDLRQKIEEENIDYSTLFFKTDHHWNIETAFWAYQEIDAEINNRFGYDINKMYFDTDEWNSVIYKNAFLGSQGARVGSLYAGMDDVAVYYPKFETSFTKEFSKKTSHEDVVRTGDFTQAVLEGYKPDDASYKPVYTTYLVSDCDEVKIENNMPATDKKALIIKDSFGIPVSAFLSTVFSETRVVDLRYLNIGVRDYIREYDPDIIIFIYNPGAVGSETFFTFGE